MMRRVVAGVLVLVAVSMAVFALFFYGPNDPAYQYCPENRCTPAKLEQIHHQMGGPHAPRDCPRAPSCSGTRCARRSCRS